MDIEKRLARLERSNRMYRFLGTVLVLGIVAILTLAMAADEPEEFRIYDEDGNQRARLGMSGASPGLFIFSAQGKRQLYVGLDGNDKPVIKFFNEAGRESAYVNMYGFGKGIVEDAVTAPVEIVCFSSKSDGKIYHICSKRGEARCRDIGDGFIQFMKMDDAKRRGLTPCSLCFPESE
jgi:hypothetical protein